LPEHPPHHRDYIPTGRFNPDLGTHWDDFIATAAAESVQDRFSDAGSMLRALDLLESRWLADKQNTCRLAPPPAPVRPPVSCGKRLRAAPLKVAPQAAAACFGLDEAFRPAAFSLSEFQDKPPGMVADPATGLRWQRSGSRLPLTWRQAQAYIQRLNETGFGGLTNWRLPTVDELMTLLRPVPQGHNLCMAPIFDPLQKRLWSIDRRSFTAAYYVSVDLGFVAWQDFSAPYHVRAVCSDPETECPEYPI
jgi:hypothetical protein